MIILYLSGGRQRPGNQSPDDDISSLLNTKAPLHPPNRIHTSCFCFVVLLLCARACICAQMFGLNVRAWPSDRKRRTGLSSQNSSPSRPGGGAYV